MNLPTTMRAVYLDGARNLVMREEPVPVYGDDQILVKIACVGICGSDLHYFEHARIGPFVADRPLILGHESAGQVVAVGSRVTTHQLGDRVALEPGVPCGQCEDCKRGRYNLCPDMVFMASAPAEHGSLREYMAYDPHFAYPLLPQVSYAEGALTEPLAAAVYGCRQGRVAPGDTVAILGCGPIGLLLAQVARASGASRILAVDRYPFRLELAQQLGAETLNLEEGDIVQRLLDLTAGQGAEVVLEASGAESAMCQSLEVARRGGRVVLIGWPQQRTFPFPIQDIGPRELELHGMFRYSNVYPEALALVAHGQVALQPLITHRFPFRDVGETFQQVLDNRDSIIKAVIDLELP